VILRSIVSASTLAAILVSLVAASASAAPPRATDCSGVLLCATVNSSLAADPSRLVLDRPWYRQGFQPGDRGDAYPRGSWYKPFPVLPNNATPRW
jgi:hypothetical protein